MRTNPVPVESGSSGPRDTVGGRARREQIEQAAAEVLADVGYAAASVGRIAEHAGVSKGVITYHFPSKDQLLRRVALRLFEDSAAHVAAVAADATTPADRLRARITGELGFFSSRRVEFRAMSEVMANHRDPDFHRAFADASAAEVETLADLLAEGQAAGQFRRFEVGEVAHAISAATYGVLDRWADDEAVDLGVAAEALWDFIAHAVAARAR